LFYMAELRVDRVSAWDVTGAFSVMLPVSEPVDVTCGEYTPYQRGDRRCLRSDGSGGITLFASDTRDAAGITPHPEGGVAVAFGQENSIYRFAEESAALALNLTVAAQVWPTSGQR
jgi:hypothetical protein